MSDELDTSLEVIEVEESGPSSSTAPRKASSSKTPSEEALVQPTIVISPALANLRGNALYARLAVLMGSSVPVADALAEMKEMSKQINARKAAAGVTEMWDAGEEVGGTDGSGGGAAGSSGSTGNRPPPKRVGPPPAVHSGAPNRLLVSSPARPGKPGTSTDKSSSSGSEESQDASSVSERAKASASEIPKTSNKLCIACHETTSGSSTSNPLLTCSVCTLPTHAKCAKPPVDKEGFSSYTCATCTRRPSRSESPKPTRTAIQITAPHDRRKKPAEITPKMTEAKKRRLEGESKKKKSEEPIHFS